MTTLLKIEMENGKKYEVQYPESIEFFLQEIQFAQENKFLLTNKGNYIKMASIVEFEPENK